MLSGDTVGFAHMTLDMLPQIFNFSDMFSLRCKELRMIDMGVLERADIKCVAAPPAV